MIFWESGLREKILREKMRNKMMAKTMRAIKILMMMGSSTTQCLVIKSVTTSSSFLPRKVILEMSLIM